MIQTDLCALSCLKIRRTEPRLPWTTFWTVFQTSLIYMRWEFSCSNFCIARNLYAQFSSCPSTNIRWLFFSQQITERVEERTPYVNVFLQVCILFQHKTIPRFRHLYLNISWLIWAGDWEDDYSNGRDATLPQRNGSWSQGVFQNNLLFFNCTYISAHISINWQRSSNHWCHGDTYEGSCW